MVHNQPEVITVTASTPKPYIGKFDTRTAASYMGLSGALLKRERREGRGPNYIRVGRRVIYDISDLDDDLDKRRVTTRS